MWAESLCSFSNFYFRCYTFKDLMIYGKDFGKCYLYKGSRV